MTEAQKLADLMHQKTCHWNHTDGCGYFYFDWNDKNLGTEKKEQLKKAEAILKIVDYNTAVQIINNL